MGHFVAGSQELRPGRLEALLHRGADAGRARPARQVRFGFGGKGLWTTLEPRRPGQSLEPPLVAEVKFSGRHRFG
jgi:hypothetical protein